MEQNTGSGARNDAIVVWTVSVLLAAVFVTTGMAKLIGSEPIGLQAAAMNGFPQWIRTLVGIVEVGAGIALLVPAVAAVSASMLALLMVPATITQWVSGEPGLFVPVLLFALLLLVAWRRNPAIVREGYAAVSTPRPIVKDGVMAGLIGATAIAVWFFFVDAVAGEMLFTPRTLGYALVSIFGPVPENQSALVLIALYTVFHYAAFIVVGLIAAMIVELAKEEPSVLMGFVVLFAAIEVGFYALVGLLQQATPLGSLAWYNVMVGNLLAAATMGLFLLRTHPVLKHQFAASMS
jgi:uncharacterized membrane protein YphA (DoxX/SURF4 family)